MITDYRQFLESKIVTVDDWTGCYPSRWHGVITPEAIVHPAKFSSRLIRHIYEHMAGEGWLHGEAVTPDAVRVREDCIMFAYLDHSPRLG